MALNDTSKSTLSSYWSIESIIDKTVNGDVEELISCKTNIGGFFFDGFFDIEHKSDLKITSHPVQSGASLTDHAYMEPVELTMTVRMSDCNEDIVSGQFTPEENDPDNFETKRSMNAFGILQTLQKSRIPIAVTTRLRNYENMLIKSITAPDDGDHLFGMEATVTLQEIIVAQANVVKTKVSERKQTTNSTDGGTESGSPLDDSSILSAGVKTILQWINQG